MEICDSKCDSLVEEDSLSDEFFIDNAFGEVSSTDLPFYTNKFQFAGR